MTSKSIKIRKHDIPYTEEEVPVKELAFYPMNPRLYTWLATSGVRDQATIQKRMEKMEHVRELRTQIDNDGKVNEPLYCIEIPADDDLRKQYKYQVLEGNRRLAALKMVKQTSLPPQSKVTCHILNLSEYDDRSRESLIFSLLGQFHITGKQRWESYETAAYIYHRHIVQKISIDAVAKESSLSKAKVKHIINAYEMMRDAKDSKSAHWSYYLAYVSSGKIKKFRDKQDDESLDKRVVELIRGDALPRATTFRDKLPLILGLKGARRTFYDEGNPTAFEDAVAIVDDSGSGNRVLQMLKTTRNRLATPETKKKVTGLLKSSTTKGETRYELTQIRRQVDSMLKKEPKND